MRRPIVVFALLVLSALILMGNLRCPGVPQPPPPENNDVLDPGEVWCAYVYQGETYYFDLTPANCARLGGTPSDGPPEDYDPPEPESSCW